MARIPHRSAPAVPPPDPHRPRTGVQKQKDVKRVVPEHLYGKRLYDQPWNEDMSRYGSRETLWHPLRPR